MSNNKYPQFDVSETSSEKLVSGFCTFQKFLQNLTKENTFIKIPLFQRNYVWKNEQIEILFEDIISMMKKNKDLWLGIVLTSIKTEKENTNNNEITQISIIDGQQRTITFLLIYFLLKIGNEINLNNIDLIDKRSATIEVEDNQSTAINFYKVEEFINQRKEKKVELSELNKIVGFIGKKISDLESETEFKLFLEKNVTITNLVVEEDYSYFESINSKGLELSLCEQCCAFLQAYNPTAEILEESDTDLLGINKIMNGKKGITKKFIHTFIDSVESSSYNYYYRFKKFIIDSENNKYSLKQKIKFFINYYEFYTEKKDIENEKNKTFYSLYFKNVAIDTNLEIYIILKILLNKNIIEEKFMIKFFEFIFVVDIILHISNAGKELDAKDVIRCAYNIYDKSKANLFLKQDIKNKESMEKDLNDLLYKFYKTRLLKFNKSKPTNWNWLLSRISFGEGNINKRIPTFFYLISQTIKSENSAKQNKDSFILKSIKNKNYFDFIQQKIDIDHILARKEEKLAHNMGSAIDSLPNLWLLKSGANRDLGNQNIDSKFNYLNDGDDPVPSGVRNYFYEVKNIQKKYKERDQSLDIQGDVEAFWAKIYSMILDNWEIFYKLNLIHAIETINNN